LLNVARRFEMAAAIDGLIARLPSAA
jgi:hypothetical protein